MTAPARTARLSEDGLRVILSGRIHTHVFDRRHLRRVIGLYRGLAERRDGKFAEHYAPSVEALERLARQVDA